MSSSCEFCANATNIEECGIYYNLCLELTIICFYIFVVFGIFVIILELIVIIISLSNRIREKYKYFILHTALLNLIFMSTDFALIIFSSIQADIVDKIANFVGYLAALSAFSLTINRFVYFYFKSYYVRYFTTRGIFIFLISYDFTLSCLTI